MEFLPNYNGTSSSTLNGLTCQRWDSQNPHKHHYTDSGLFPEVALEEVANYCRTPDGSRWPWCFTMSPDVRSQLCYFDVKLCVGGLPAGTVTHRGRDKMTAISQTILWNAFSWIQMLLRRGALLIFKITWSNEFRLKFHWSLFLSVPLRIFHHWLR